MKFLEGTCSLCVAWASPITQLSTVLLAGNDVAGALCSGGVNALNGNQIADSGRESTDGGQANGGSNTITG